MLLCESRRPPAPLPCTGHEGDVFALLSNAAEENRRCPSDAEIAALLGCGEEAAGGIVAALQCAGRVRLRWYGNRRVAVIIATGKSTALP